MIIYNFFVLDIVFKIKVKEVRFKFCSLFIAGFLSFCFRFKRCRFFSGFIIRMIIRFGRDLFADVGIFFLVRW